MSDVNFKEFINADNEQYTYFMTYFSEHYASSLYYFALKVFFLNGGVLTDEMQKQKPGEFMDKVELPTPTFLFVFNNLVSFITNNPEIDNWGEELYDKIAEAALKEYQLFKQTGDIT
jgi:hypothetical protein